MLKKLNIREKKLLLIAVLFIGILWIQSSLFSPILNYLTNIHQQINSKSFIYEKYQKYLTHRDQIVNLFEKNIGVLKKESSPQQQMSDFLQEIDRLCKSSRIKIINMKPLGLHEEETISKIMLEIEVETNPSNLGQFLHELNTSSFINVHTLRISASSSEDALRCFFTLSKIVV